MSQGTINISDLPAGGEIRQTDLIPTLRLDGLVYKTTIPTGTVVLFAGEDLTAGDALSMAVDGTIVKAKADAFQTSNVLGFAQYDVLDGAEVTFASAYATTSQTLIVSSLYYLSDITAGTIVNVAPTTSGHYIVPLGIAVTTNTIQININTPQLI